MVGRKEAPEALEKMRKKEIGLKKDGRKKGKQPHCWVGISVSIRHK